MWKIYGGILQKIVAFSEYYKNFTISKWIWPNSSLSEDFIKTNKKNSYYFHKRNTYLRMNVDFFSFWWKCVLRNVLCISTFYKKTITRVLVETEPALVFLYLDWRSCSHTGIVHLNPFKIRYPDPTFEFWNFGMKVTITFYNILTGRPGARNLWPHYVKWKFLTFCGLTGSNTYP